LQKDNKKIIAGAFATASYFQYVSRAVGRNLMSRTYTIFKQPKLLRKENPDGEKIRRRAGRPGGRNSIECFWFESDIADKKFDLDRLKFASNKPNLMVSPSSLKGTPKV
jgi:hypothetical protein